MSWKDLECQIINRKPVDISFLVFCSLQDSSSERLSASRSTSTWSKLKPSGILFTRRNIATNLTVTLSASAKAVTNKYMTVHVWELLLVR